MTKILQAVLLVLIVVGVVGGGALFFLWKDSVGLDQAAATAKSVIAAGTLLSGILGLLVAGDKTFLGDSAWAWARNRGVQSAVLLSIADLLGLAFVLWLGIAWFSFREIKVYSDQAVVLMDVDDMMTPREIGLLPADTERDVLVRIGKLRLGYRIVGTETFGIEDEITVPTRGQHLNKLIFIDTRGIRDVPGTLESPNRVEPASGIGSNNSDGG